METVITVGLDGSPESLAAGRWAADEAERRKPTVRLLHAWPMLVPEPTRTPSEIDQNYWAKRVVHNTQTELQARHPGLAVVGDRLREALRPWREKTPRVEVTDSIALGSHAKAVVRAAEGAGLLVVGRRRHRPALGPRLGPVAQAAIHHARCSVAVVPHD
ncbi:universal stress protein [Streptomyces sp. NPDC018833]|uniref:universal stress protein n=1 Tax=Streptomyces sp. NPDC018833 TaxID=3365053 RepID=UPI0037BB2318